MMRRTRLIGGIALLIGIGLLAGTNASAQDDGDGDESLDEVRALIPESEPGELDLTEADAMYGQLAAAYVASTAVNEFGDGSKLTGVCGGFAYSYDEDGQLIDAAADWGDDNPPVDLLDGGQAFTSGNRFKVDTRGVVVYYGFMPHEGDGPIDHEWEVKTSGHQPRFRRRPQPRRREPQLRPRRPERRPPREVLRQRQGDGQAHVGQHRRLRG